MVRAGGATGAALAFVERSALQARADAAVLAGVQAIDLDSYYRHGATTGTALVPSVARTKTLAYLQRSQESEEILHMEIVQLTATDHAVETVLRAPIRTAFWLVDASISVVSRAELDYVG